MADILYTTKSGTEGYTGVTTDTWFQIMDERNKMAVDFGEPGAPQIAPTEFAPKDNREELNLTIAYAQNTAAEAKTGVDVINESYVAPKSVYIINDTTGNTIYNVDETYDRIYLVNNTLTEQSEIILPSLAFFKDAQKMTIVSHPNSVFNGKISWYDDNGTKNYINAVISKDNSLEFDYWEEIGDMVIRGTYSGYTFDENYYVGLLDNELGYSIAKYSKTDSLVWSKNITTGTTYDITSDRYGNYYIAHDVSGDTVTKLDQAGNKLWGLSIGNFMKKVLINLDDMLYVAGDTFTTEYGNATIGKYDLNGTQLWGTMYTGSVNDLARSADGTVIYAVGAPTDYTDQPFALKFYSAESGDMIAEIDDFGRTEINAVAVLANNNIVVGGIIASGTTHAVYTPEGENVLSGNISYTINDILADNANNFYVCGDNITKYDIDGAIVWEATHNATLYNMGFDSDGNVYAVGNSITENPDWTYVVSSGITVYGSYTFRRTNTGGNWTQSFYSTNGYTTPFVSATTTSASTPVGRCVIGLNSDPTTDANFPSIDYAIGFVNADSVPVIYESGTLVYTHPTALAGTTTDFDITYDGTNIRYYINGSLVRTTAREFGGLLYLDSSLYTGGGNSGFANVAFGDFTVNYTSIGRVFNATTGAVIKNIPGNGVTSTSVYVK